MATGQQDTQRTSRRQFLGVVVRTGCAALVAPLLSACVQTAAPAPTAAPASAPTMAPAAAPTSQAAAPAPATAAPAAKPALKEVSIGCVYPLTGPSAATGIDLTNGYKLAEEVINGRYPDLGLPGAADEGLANLGGAKVRFIFADHASDPAKGQAETERLITQEKVAAVAGCFISGVTAPASQAAERLGVPFLDPDAIAPALIKRNFKWFFRITADEEIFDRDWFFPKFLPDFEKRKNTKIKSIVLFHENTLSGNDMATYVKEYGPKAGYEVVDDIAYPPKTTNLTSETQRLKSINADLVMSMLYISEAILAKKTWEELDYSPPMHFDIGGHRAAQYTEAVPKGAIAELQRDEFSLGFSKSRPVVGKVNEMFRAKFGSDLNTDSSRTFMGGIVLADAINRAGSTEPGRIREALLQTRIPAEQTVTAWGGIEFDPANGQNRLATYCIQQFLDGRWRLVWPFDAAEVDLVYPAPKWSQRG